MNQRGTLFVLAANPEVALARADILLFGLSLASVEKRSESDGGVDVCLWKVFGRRAWHEIRLPSPWRARISYLDFA